MGVFTKVDELMTVTFQSTSVLDPVIHPQTILRDGEGMELFSIYNHRFVDMYPRLRCSACT
jgi:hypothetical protein